VPVAQQARQAVTGSADDAEIEIYVSPSSNYVELEEQGPYGAVQPGETLVWRVGWYARRLPPGLVPVVGSAELVNEVRTLLE
jgi:hypothetical protein